MCFVCLFVFFGCKACEILVPESGIEPRPSAVKMWRANHQEGRLILSHTLCDFMGSSVRGIFQARILEWVAISYSRRSSRLRGWNWVSCTAGRSLPIELAFLLMFVKFIIYPVERQWLCYLVLITQSEGVNDHFLPFRIPDKKGKTKAPLSLIRQKQ